MATQCNSCGDCCDVVFLPTPLELLASQGSPSNQRWFLSGELVLLTKEEAIARKPRLAKDADFEWDYSFGHRVPYLCTNFDMKTKQCALHGTPDKPDVCTHFPWYGMDPNDKDNANRLNGYPRCSFWADIQPQWLLGLS